MAFREFLVGQFPNFVKMARVRMGLARIAGGRVHFQTRPVGGRQTGSDLDDSPGTIACAASVPGGRVASCRSCRRQLTQATPFFTVNGVIEVNEIRQVVLRLASREGGRPGAETLANGEPAWDCRAEIQREGTAYLFLWGACRPYSTPPRPCDSNDSRSPIRRRGAYD